MIDLHMHTTYSDGSNTVEEVLEKAEKLKLEIISITDHDNCKAYKELKNEEIRSKFSGKIIPGHGGILDRFDSMIFVFPIMHFFGLF